MRWALAQRLWACQLQASGSRQSGGWDPAIATISVTLASNEESRSASLQAMLLLHRYACNKVFKAHMGRLNQRISHQGCSLCMHMLSPQAHTYLLALMCLHAQAA